MKKLLNKSFSDHLKESCSYKTYEPILDLIEGINFINASIRNANGLTTIDKIYIDVDGILTRHDEDKLIHVILHELAHYYRIQKKGKDWYYNYVFHADMDEYVEQTIFEENFADRWATLKYNKLYNDNRVVEYRDFGNGTFLRGMIEGTHTYLRLKNINNESELEESLKKFILYVRQ